MFIKSLKTYLGDGLLIIFSVLFALFINNLAEKSRTNAEKEAALDSIKKELRRNSGILTMWKAHHTSITNKLDSLVKGKNEALKDSLQKQKYLELRYLTDNKSLIDAIISDTAWESAKATGIISEFDFSRTENLTNVYKMQDVLMNRTLQSILDLYFDKDSHRMDDLIPTMNQFKLRFQELVGQEILMEQLYTMALEDLKGKTENK